MNFHSNGIKIYNRFLCNYLFHSSADSFPFFNYLTFTTIAHPLTPWYNYCIRLLDYFVIAAKYLIVTNGGLFVVLCVDGFTVDHSIISFTRFGFSCRAIKYILPLPFPQIN